MMLLLALILGLPQAAAGEPSERRIELVETIRLKRPPGSGRVRLWIPKPPSERWQAAELEEVLSPWTYRLAKEPEFGNELVVIESGSKDWKDVEIRLRYRISRREQSPAQGSVSRLDLLPRGRVVINDEVRRIAAEAVRGIADPYEKARALYGYVLSKVRYDKSGEGWGQGDVLYVCRAGKGNCTDFHSLFMALAQSQGIPARFRIGFPIPAAPQGPVEAPYHCWAEFHVPAKGWVPVDISEAWKLPARAAYYFGRLDSDRVVVSTGRELSLGPGHGGPPLNFLYRPYAESDGAPVAGLEFRRSYRALAPGSKS